MQDYKGNPIKITSIYIYNLCIYESIIYTSFFIVGGPNVDLYYILNIQARHTESEVVPVFVFGMFLGSSHTKPRAMALMSRAKKQDFIENMPLTSLDIQSFLLRRSGLRTPKLTPPEVRFFGFPFTPIRTRYDWSAYYERNHASSTPAAPSAHVKWDFR